MTKKMTTKGALQGDIAIVPIADFPSDAKPTKNRILAYGEVTGHHHQISGNVDMRETQDAFYFRVAPDADAQIIHIGDDHETIEILPSIVWRVAKVSQVEYTFEEERQVSD